MALLRGFANILGLIIAAISVKSSHGGDLNQRELAQEHYNTHLDGGGAQSVPFAYCKPYLERLSLQDQHQLRESYQKYHAAYAHDIRSGRNLDAFRSGPPEHAKGDQAFIQAWNITYMFGQNLTHLEAVRAEASTALKNMESRIKVQLQKLEEAGHLPPGTDVDALSPCIMRKIYPSQFPDQPDVSLLLMLRGDPPNPSDWPPSANSTKEPPTGKGPESVSAFLQQLSECRSLMPLELVVALSGSGALKQTTTWAWQSWTSQGLVVPLLDTSGSEAHVLNRLAAVARGSLVVLLRADRPGLDHMLPAPGSGCAWLQRIVTLYHRIPQLGAMTHGRYSFSHPADGPALRQLGGLESPPPAPSGNSFFKERVTSVPFQYVLMGDYSPMSFRRSALEEVGGFDEDLPQGDEPCSSYIRRDLTLRLWKSGWRVGAHDAGLATQPAPATPGNSCTPQVATLAARLLESRHASADAPAAGLPLSAMDAIMARVRELNIQQLDPISQEALNPCPMAQGCKA